MAAATSVRPRRVDNVWQEMERMHNEIMKRAHELFQNGGARIGRALDDWLTAENELVWKPAVELGERNNEFTIQVGLAGIEARDLDVQVTPQDLLIKANINHRHKPEEGAIHLCEFRSGPVFRTVHFPKAIDPDKVNAEYRNGLLRVTAPVAAEKRARKLEIAAA